MKLLDALERVLLSGDEGNSKLISEKIGLGLTGNRSDIVFAMWLYGKVEYSEFPSIEFRMELVRVILKIGVGRGWEDTKFLMECRRWVSRGDRFSFSGVRRAFVLRRQNFSIWVRFGFRAGAGGFEMSKEVAFLSFSNR